MGGAVQQQVHRPAAEQPQIASAGHQFRASVPAQSGRLDRQAESVQVHRQLQEAVDFVLDLYVDYKS